mmetsp:Transcript_177439/g.569015  ORF Transcript_177439/g.569015 Transcript_177439/m.569015 type:complete len:202 (-) Transcript_177439:145-750(-)
MDFWVADPIARRATCQPFVAQQLLRVHGPHVLAFVASILQVLRRLRALLLRHLGDAPPLVLAIPAIMPKFISVLQPYVAELAPVLPALAACHVHEPAHVDLALESAIATDHGNVVHVERDGPRRQASLLPALAGRATVLDGLEGLHGDRRVALATDHTRRLRQKLPVFVEVLDRPLRPACRALVLEELEGGVSLSAAISSL